MKQNIRRINFFAILFFIILSESCNSEPIDPHVVISISDEFKIDLWETLATDVSSLKIHVETIDSLYCENSLIEINNDRLSSQALRLTINGVDTSDNCVTESFPAKSIENIGHLPNGVFKFDINLKGTTIPNTGTLVVSDESYQLNMETKNGFKILHPTLLRVPRQTIWGLVNFRSNSQAVNASTSFLREIKNISTQKEYLEGYYGHFSIVENNAILTEYDTNLPNTKSFIFDYSNDIDEIQTLVNQYREEAGEWIEIQIFTWDGRAL